MNCFYHQDTSAVGICKNCQRGLCSSCLSEVVDGIACKNRCEEMVLQINEIVAKSRRIYSNLPRSRYLWTAFYVVFGSMIMAHYFFEIPRMLNVAIWGALFFFAAWATYSSYKTN